MFARHPNSGRTYDHRRSRRHALGLLRKQCERPSNRHAPEMCGELPPPHSTSASMTWELEYQMILCWALGIAATEHARLALVRSGSTTEPWAASPKVRCPRTEARRLARMQRPQRGISARIRRLARVTAKGREPSLGIGYQASCVDDPVEARAIWYVAPRSGAVMCPAYVARPEDRWP